MHISTDVPRPPPSTRSPIRRLRFRTDRRPVGVALSSSAVATSADLSRIFGFRRSCPFVSVAPLAPCASIPRTMNVDVTGLARQGGVAASAVEQELQRYIRDKGVNELFISITERCGMRSAHSLSAALMVPPTSPLASPRPLSLLMSKPDNPVQFIVDFLQDRYPDQVRDCARRLPSIARETCTEERDSHPPPPITGFRSTRGLFCARLHRRRCGRHRGCQRRRQRR